VTLLDLFTAAENSPVGEAIRDSQWLFPVIECFHLLALAVLGGAVLIVNLSLLGWGLGRERAAQLWRDTRVAMGVSIVVMLVSGGLLFTSEAMKLYYHEAFWVKMTALVLSLIFMWTVQRRTALSQDLRATVWSRVVAITSLSLWFLVGAGGRWIGFS
jgi:hypothetical protein